MRFWLVFLFLSPFPLAFMGGRPASDRGHDLAKQANGVKRQICRDVKSIEDCHARYPAGCSTPENPDYDPYLTFLKDQLPDPGSPVSGTLTRSDFANLERAVPDAFPRGGHAAYANTLADLGEGNIYSLVGYLYYAIPSVPEPPNCQLKGARNYDFHVGIGFRPEVAAKLRSGVSIDKAELEPSSVIVEMTPYYRVKYHPMWTLARVKSVIGKQVKVVGQLIIDDHGILPSRDCGRADADRSSCWRVSAWEVHPVIQLYVCNGKSPCASESTEWIPLDKAH